MVEPWAYYTEWSKSEREKQLSYINAYIWNLERWYWWTYLQGSSGDADIENRPMNKSGGEEEEREMNGESSMEAYTLPYVKYIDSGNFFVWHRECKPGLCNSIEEWEMVGGGRFR